MNTSSTLVLTPARAGALVAGAAEVVAAFRICTETAESNDASLTRLRAMTEQIGVAESSLIGPLSLKSGFGHVLLLRGEHGYLRFEIHSDKKYFEPLVVRKGRRAPNLGIYAAGGCTLTKVCTSTIDLSGGPSTCDFEDLGAEDPPTGVFVGYEYAPRSASSRLDTDVLVAALSDAARILDLPPHAAVDPDECRTALGELLARAKPATGYFSHHADRGTAWFDWLILPSNGTSAFIQVMRGPSREPVIAVGREVDTGSITTSYGPLHFDGAGRAVAFPHVSQAVGDPS